MISLFSDGKWLKWLSKTYIFPPGKQLFKNFTQQLLNFNNGEF